MSTTYEYRKNCNILLKKWVKAPKPRDKYYDKQEHKFSNGLDPGVISKFWAAAVQVQVFKFSIFGILVGTQKHFRNLGFAT